MRSLLPVHVLAGTLAGTLAAQPTPQPGKRQFDGSAEFSSRHGITVSAGRMATHFPAGGWLGVSPVVSFTFTLQDQDGRTPETVGFEVRRQDPTTAFPDWTGNPGSPLLRVTIPLPPSTRPATYTYTITPSTPLSLPAGESFYLVWDLPAAPQWANDGVGVHMGAGSPYLCGGIGVPCCGPAALPAIGPWERPRGHPPSGTPANIENLCPTDTSIGQIRFAGLDQQLIHWLQTRDPVLQKLASNPNAFCPVNQPNSGHAAMDPDVADELGQGRHDDIGWRVNGGASYAGGVAFVLLTQCARPAALALPFGELWLDPTDPLFTLGIQGPIVLDTTGVGATFLPLGPPGSPARGTLAAFGNLHAQAAVVDGALGGLLLTNLDTMRFKWPGGTAFTITAATPFTVPLAGARDVVVQNDGNGEVTVEFLDAGGAGLGWFPVKERTTGCARAAGGIPAGAVNVRLATRNQDVWINNPTRGRWALVP